MNILVKYGYLSHQDKMYGKGNIVDIEDKDILADLLASDQFEEYKEVPVKAPAEGKPTKSGKKVAADASGSLPEADVTKAVKK